MDVLKVAAIAALMAGVTWAADVVGGPPDVVGGPQGPTGESGLAPLPRALSADGAATGAPASAPDADPRDAGKGKPTAKIDEISDEETEKAIREAEKALSGDKPPEKSPGEFRPTAPLPADTAIALPSDI